MTGAEIKDISDKLSTLIRLLGAAIVDDKPRRDQIRLLSSAGLPPKQIAELIGTTPGTVSVELTAIRKVARVKRQKRRSGRGKADHS